MLLRITSPAEWAAGELRDDGEGFVHLSRPDQVLTPANERYHGRRDLRLLVVDDARLHGEIRVEEGFPHLYGRLTLDAVIDDLPLPADEDGAFRLVCVPMPAADPPASELIAAMVAEMAPLYGPIERPGMPTATPAELSPPTGTFLVGWDETGPVCGGGVKRLADGIAEIKRMYVVPAARSRGHARRLLAALEDAARRLGYSTVRLDTGPKQPHASALYASAGYREIGNYNANDAASYWGEKSLR